MCFVLPLKLLICNKIFTKIKAFSFRRINAYLRSLRLIKTNKIKHERHEIASGIAERKFKQIAGFLLF